jgi:5-methylcytosine-specific restriction endonuclease McrA
MSQYTVLELWNERYGNAEEILDYAGRLMLKSACGNPDSAYHPTIDHIRPLSKDGKDVKQNIEICHRDTNEEKGDNFPHWKTNGRSFHAVRTKGVRDGYTIVEDD